VRKLNRLFFFRAQHGKCNIALGCPPATAYDVTLGADVTLGGHALTQGTVICVSGTNPLDVIAIPPNGGQITVHLTVDFLISIPTCGDTGFFFAALTSIPTGSIGTNAVGACLGPVT
jgi:hypothetical protein